jgi:hypothetical protein
MNWWNDADTQRIGELRQAGREWSEIANVLGRSKESCRARLRYSSNQKPTHPSPQFTDLIQSEMNIDDWLQQLEKIQQLTISAQPQQTSAEVYIETEKPIVYIPTSCWHLGGLYTAYKEFQAKLNEVIVVDRVYWGIHGDEWENFPAGWAETVFLNIVPPHLQRMLVVKIVEKLHSLGKLLYSMWSNHPAFTEKQTGEDRSAFIYQDKVPYFRAKGILKLHVGSQTYILDLAHRFPGSSMYNPVHAQGRELSQVPQADFVVMGDRHIYAYQEFTHRTEAHLAGLQENMVAHLVQVGTAKDGPDPYTLRNFANRGVFIWPAFVLSAKAHSIHRVYDRAAMEWYLGRKDF